MGKQNKSKQKPQQSNKMNPMDQGLNLVAQTFNNATGIDKSNDGKPNNQ